MQEILNFPLGIRSDVYVTDTERNILKAIEDYDLWFVSERLESDESIDPLQIDLAINEFKRFIGLAILGYQNIAMVSPIVDEVWHNFILFTEEYADFCHSTVGGFIHHRPKTSKRLIERESAETFFSAYRNTFGEVAPLWFSKVSDGDCDSGGDGSDSGGGDSCLVGISNRHNDF